MQTHQLTRGSLANKTGVNAETIRYYEKVGVMPDPPRTVGGHRLYDEPLVRRLFLYDVAANPGTTTIQPGRKPASPARPAKTSLPAPAPIVPAIP